MYCIDCGKKLGLNGKDCELCVAEKDVALEAMRTVYIEDPSPVENASIALDPGSKVFDRYTIIERIGKGGMGVVYSAADQLTNRNVAIKLISPEIYSKSFNTRELIFEGIAARDIRHENVVSVYDVGEFENTTFVVMELLDGQTLRQWHRQQLYNDVIDIPLQTIENIMMGILNGLSQAHGSGIIHRDLKPENIMLVSDPADGAGCVKILDFGLARAAQNRSQHFSGTARGTASYIAPEQLTHSGLETETADIYAVSKIIFELLVGSLPDGHWQAPSTFRSDVSKQLDDLIQSGLSVRPTMRPSTTGQFKSLMLAGLKSPTETANSSSYLKKIFRNKKLSLPKFRRVASTAPVDAQVPANSEHEFSADAPIPKRLNSEGPGSTLRTIAERARPIVRIGLCSLLISLFVILLSQHIGSSGDSIDDAVFSVLFLLLTVIALMSIRRPLVLRYLIFLLVLTSLIFILFDGYMSGERALVSAVFASLTAAIWFWELKASKTV